ncbi:MAG: bifunctional diguanylate cyclase/phosphodiesterase, partial [Microcystaceae cyanobacterium]
MNDEVFEQSIHYIPESDLVRIFLVDITERKRIEAARQQAEEELRKRGCLLQAVAEATNYLLTEMNHEKAIGKALAILGQATDADRACIFENHPHSATGEMAMSMRFEWSRQSVKASIRQPYWQNQPYKAYGLTRWYNTLSTGQSISGPVREFPMGEQAILNWDNIQSILVVPLLLNNEFWGYISLINCHSGQYWSKHEESTLCTMAASISGALQRQQKEEVIRYQALHDSLTGLPNRMLFNELLSKALPNADRRGESLAVMFVDLDRFKTINDTLGHTVGDQLLQEVAQRLTDSLRAGDTVARWGGDEFTILLPQVKQIEDVSNTAERIIQALESVFRFDGHELYVTASIGIALFDDDSYDVETLIKQADAALYRAKEQGKNQYQFYDPFMDTKAPELLIIEKNLRHALKRGELLVYYQPQVNIVTGEITGMEALLRWQHPEMGMIAPNVFIPIAEECGLITSIGKWVLRTACMQNKAWQDEGLPPISMAVNLSLKQFRQPNLVRTVAEILEKTGLESHFLELEITETTAIQDLEFTTTVLQQLEQMGVRLSIDDFGTGHSSLNRLQLLPLHNLKVDRSFIQDLTIDIKMSHIVTAIVALGQSLGLNIIAEGIEKKEQLEFLKSINCQAGQGFLFYQPTSSQKAT